MQRLSGGVGSAPGPDSASVSQVIPFSIPRIEYAVEHLFVGGLFANGGATLLEKLYVCQDSDVGHGAGDRAGGDLSPRKGLCGPGLVGCLWLIV